MPSQHILNVEKGAWPNDATAPPTKLCASSPTIRLHVHARKSVHICIMSQLTKKSLGAMTKTKQEVGHFEFIVAFWCNLCHFHVSHFNELLLAGSSVPHKNRSAWTKDLNDEKLSKSWVFVKWRDRGEASNFSAKQEVILAGDWSIFDSALASDCFDLQSCGWCHWTWF